VSSPNRAERLLKPSRTNPSSDGASSAATSGVQRPLKLSRDASAAAALLFTALASAAAIYFRRLGGEFVFDDLGVIVANPAIRTPARALDAFGLASVLGQGRPLTNLTFAFDFAAFGPDPRAFHATGVALHLANSLGVFALFAAALRRAEHPRASSVAASVAGTFALHPLATEAVCYASQRAEVLASGLLLATIALLLAADAARTQGPRWMLATGATVVMLAALAAKSIAIVAPAAFVLHRVALPRREDHPPLRRAGRAFLVAAPTWAIAIASLCWNLTKLGPGDSAGLDAAGGLGPWRYLLTQTRVHWMYVRLLIWPEGQSIEHSVPPSPGFAHPPTLAALAGVVLLLAVAVILWARAERGEGGQAHRAAAFGIGWWLLLLTPTSSIIPIDDLAFERRTYLAAAGLFLALAVGIDALLACGARRRRGTVAGPALVVLAWVALSTALLQRVAVWRSEAALWADAARRNPESSRVANNLGYGLMRAGDLAGAEAAYIRAAALARKTDDMVGASRNLADLKLVQDRPDASLAALEPGLRASPNDFELRMLRARALHAMGRPEEALADARRAAVRAPGRPEPHALLGWLLLHGRESVEALAELERAIEIDPADARSSWRRVAALGLSGRVGEACALWSSLGGTRAAPPDASEAVWAAGWLGCERH